MKRKAVRRRTVSESCEDRDLAAIAGAVLDQTIERWGPYWGVVWSTPSRVRDPRTGQLKAFELNLWVEKMAKPRRKA